MSGRSSNLSDIPQGASSGQRNSLSLFLDAEIFEIDKISAFGQTGFRFGLGHPKDVPFIKDYLAYISPGCGLNFLYWLSLYLALKYCLHSFCYNLKSLEIPTNYKLLFQNLKISEFCFSQNTG